MRNKDESWVISILEKIQTKTFELPTVEQLELLLRAIRSKTREKEAEEIALIPYGFHTISEQRRRKGKIVLHYFEKKR